MKTKQHDSIMVVMDNLLKEAHFILVNSMHKASDKERVFMEEVFKLHGLFKEIVLDHDAKFTSNFYKGLFQDLGNYMNFSTTYHP